MSVLVELAIVFAASVALVALATKHVLRLLTARQILDIPNERSSHVRPVPRGGGIGVMAMLLAILAIVAIYLNDVRALWFLPGLVLLLAVSWRDDRASQSAWLRLACQFAAVSFALGGLSIDTLIFQGLMPLAVDRIFAAFAWVWFINLVNFMDGIDGITGVEMASIGVGVSAVVLVTGIADEALLLYAAALAGAAAGFLVWNWHPAKLFLGDVGSVPLGFFAGGLLILLAANGALAAAFILPAYYLADATLTLLWRLRRGEKMMQAHRHHWYQHAAARIGHKRTSLTILAANVLLIIAGLFATTMLVPAGLLAAAVVAGVLGWFSVLARRPH